MGQLTLQNIGTRLLTRVTTQTSSKSRVHRGTRRTVTAVAVQSSQGRANSGPEVSPHGGAINEDEGDHEAGMTSASDDLGFGVSSSDNQDSDEEDHDEGDLSYDLSYDQHYSHSEDEHEEEAGGEVIAL